MGDVPFLDMLADESVLLDRPCLDWREAVAAAGEGLVAAGLTTDEYTREMIATIEKLGPYIVIAPGLALAHSRPSPSVLRTGFSWLRPAEPVEFGHDTNDPVHLVVGLAATDHTFHQRALMELANLFLVPGVMERLNAVEDAEELRRQIGQLKDGG